MFTFFFVQTRAQITENHHFVFLGEPTHGDGAIFDEKVKIIKKLHQEKNFTTVLFEAGFYDNFKAWELYQENKDISIYNRSVFAIWSETKPFQELISYVKQNSAMKILGVDCQEGELFQQYYLKDLKDVLQKNNISFSETEFLLLDKTLIYKDLEYLKNNKPETNKLFLVYDQFLKALASIKNKDFKTKVYRADFQKFKDRNRLHLKKNEWRKFSGSKPKRSANCREFYLPTKRI